MLVLGVNTATSISQIALVENGTVVAENSWPSEQNESEKLLPGVQKMLTGSGKTWQDLDKLIVIQGPGPFTALRVSIAAVNALSYGLKIPVTGIPVVDYWKYRFNGDFIIYAGLNRVYFRGNLKDFDDVLEKIEPKTKISGHIKENQIEALTEKGVTWIDEKNLPTLGDFIVNLKKNYEEKSLVEPLYFAPPHITKSSKAYK